MLTGLAMYVRAMRACSDLDPNIMLIVIMLTRYLNLSVTATTPHQDDQGAESSDEDQWYGVAEEYAYDSAAEHNMGT